MGHKPRQLGGDLEINFKKMASREFDIIYLDSDGVAMADHEMIEDLCGICIVNAHNSSEEKHLINAIRLHSPYMSAAHAAVIVEETLNALNDQEIIRIARMV